MELDWISEKHQYRGFTIKSNGDTFKVYLDDKIVLDDHKFKRMVDIERHIDSALDALESLII